MSFQKQLAVKKQPFIRYGIAPKTKQFLQTFQQLSRAYWSVGILTGDVSLSLRSDSLISCNKSSAHLLKIFFGKAILDFKIFLFFDVTANLVLDRLLKYSLSSSLRCKNFKKNCSSGIKPFLVGNSVIALVLPSPNSYLNKEI